jgi:flavin-dependent dehydrogenase
LTSVGVLVSPEHIASLKEDHEAALRRFIDQCPVIRGYLSKAIPAAEAPYDQIRIRKDFSYAQSRFWRPGFVSVGDCACFVDVLLSSGVHLSTYGALLAARSINSALRGDLNEAFCFDEFEIRYRIEFGKFYQLLIGLYDMRRDSKTYHMWLRYWIRSTNAFSLEPADLGLEPAPAAATEGDDSLSAEIAKKQRDQLGYLRQLNRTLLESQEGPLTMEQVPKIPFLQGTLQIASDRLHWELPRTR